MGRFENRVVVVTGGALGIGRCLCGAFAAEGASVAFLDWDAEAGEAFLPVLQQTSPDAFFMAGDAADPRVLGAFAGAVRDRYGRVDVLVNNACFSNRGLLSGCSWEDFNEILKVGGSAACQRLRLGIDARPPHEQGAGVLRRVPVGVAEGIDGERPTRRGRPPAAVGNGKGATPCQPRGSKRDSQGINPLSGCGQGPP